MEEICRERRGGGGSGGGDGKRSFWRKAHVTTATRAARLDEERDPGGRGRGGDDAADLC